MIPACGRLYTPFCILQYTEPSGMALLNDIFGHVSDVKAHVFVSGHRVIEIKILDVHRHEFCSGG